MKFFHLIVSHLFLIFPVNSYVYDVLMIPPPPLCFQTAKGYILLFDVLGGGDDKYLYEPVYPK